MGFPSGAMIRFQGCFFVKRSRGVLLSEWGFLKALQASFVSIAKYCEFVCSIPIPPCDFGEVTLS